MADKMLMTVLTVSLAAKGSLPRMLATLPPQPCRCSSAPAEFPLGDARAVANHVA